jgi:hypothetical protein
MDPKEIIFSPYGCKTGVMRIKKKDFKELELTEDADFITIKFETK